MPAQSRTSNRQRAIEESIFRRLALRVRVVPVMPGVLAAQRLKARRVEDLRHRAAGEAAPSLDATPRA